MSIFHSQPHRRDAGQSARSINPQEKPSQWTPRRSPRSLRKGATFHSSKSPPSSPTDDPALHIAAIPCRSPTCPDTIEDLVASHERRIEHLLNSVERSLSGLDFGLHPDLDVKQSSPVPRVVAAHAQSPDPMPVDVKPPKSPSQEGLGGKLAAATDHHHDSDSGLGSSISGSTSAGRRTARELGLGMWEAMPLGHLLTSSPLTHHHQVTSPSRRSSVYADTDSDLTAVNHSVAANSSSSQVKGLSEVSVKRVRDLIVSPILAEKKLRAYHSLVSELPERINDKAITCLRDLEKTLIFLAPVSADLSLGEGVLAECFIRAKSKAKSAASYLNFCETSIQCIHTTVDYLNEQEQRRPTDRPYTNNYFLDLVQQVRQYARIMAVSRQRQAEGTAMDEHDYSPLVTQPWYDSHRRHVLTYRRDEQLRLKGGATQDGKPLELVREKDGREFPIQSSVTMPPPPEDPMMDDDAERTMARKRKCDQGKIDWRQCRECEKWFKRPCDLTKHEKTHSRPWKCSTEGCRYHTLGWPTEKERDRHVNDKHSSAPPMFKCLYKDCTYTSKRESNCKQHMEKAHKWEYVRSKSKKAQYGANLVPVAQSPTSVQAPTPDSAMPSLSSPESAFAASPFDTSVGDFSPVGSVNTADSAFMPGQGQDNFADTFKFSALNEQPMDWTFTNTFGNNGQPISPGDSEGISNSAENGFGHFDFSSIDPSIPQSAWEAPFDFSNNNDTSLQTMNDFFPQYHTTQQPTPALTDFDNVGQPCSGEHNIYGMPDAAPTTQNLTPGASGNLSLSGSTGSFDNTGFNNEPASAGDDFTLFGGGELGPPGGESSSMAQMFPSLDNLGDQFHDNDDAMFNPMKDAAMDDTIDPATMFPGLY
ncbi:MAG: copper-binding transcription factor [Alyxoria varia]|nr:MAG: copper-binding transcription factor [Alyxoria varia]